MTLRLTHGGTRVYLGAYGSRSGGGLPGLTGSGASRLTGGLTVCPSVSDGNALRETVLTAPLVAVLGVVRFVDVQSDLQREFEVRQKVYFIRFTLMIVSKSSVLVVCEMHSDQ